MAQASPPSSIMPAAPVAARPAASNVAQASPLPVATRPVEAKQLAAAPPPVAPAAMKPVLTPSFAQAAPPPAATKELAAAGNALSSVLATSSTPLSPVLSRAYGLPTLARAAPAVGPSTAPPVTQVAALAPPVPATPAVTTKLAAAKPVAPEALPAMILASTVPWKAPVPPPEAMRPEFSTPATAVAASPSNRTTTLAQTSPVPAAAIAAMQPVAPAVPSKPAEPAIAAAAAPPAPGGAMIVVSPMKMATAAAPAPVPMAQAPGLAWVPATSTQPSPAAAPTPAQTKSATATARAAAPVPAPVAAPPVVASAAPPPPAKPKEKREAVVRDGDRVDLARQVVAKLLPPGQYRTLMTALMADTTAGLVREMKAPALAQSLAAIGMVEGSDLKQEDIDKAVEILDPTYNQRIAVSTEVVNDSVQAVVAKMEPQMREALAQSYANNFDAAQLADILRFFDTPTGAAYASRLMLMTTDPAVKGLAAQMTPAIMKSVPSIMEQAQQAIAALPQPRDPDSLSESERRKVAHLLRTDIVRR